MFYIQSTSRSKTSWESKLALVYLKPVLAPENLHHTCASMSDWVALCSVRFTHPHTHTFLGWRAGASSSVYSQQKSVRQGGGGGRRSKMCLVMTLSCFGLVGVLNTFQPGSKTSSPTARKRKKHLLHRKIWTLNSWGLLFFFLLHWHVDISIWSYTPTWKIKGFW